MEDYTRRIEEVKEMVLGYASQSWPIIKTSVSYAQVGSTGTAWHQVVWHLDRIRT